MNGCAYLLEGATTADIGDSLIDLGVSWLWRVTQQGSRSHHHAGLAVTTLRYLVVDPGFLYFRELTTLLQAFNGFDLLAKGCAHG